MKRYCLCCVLFLSNAFTTTANADIIASFFETDAENWTVSRNGTSTSPDYLPNGGKPIGANPSGGISDTDALSGSAWFFDAPTKFIGDQSRHFNSSFSFDIKQQQNSAGSQFGANDILLDGNGLELRLDIGNDGAAGNPAIGVWTNYQFFFNELEGWTHKNGGAATDADLQSVLASIDELSIRGEYISGSVGGDTAFLDNVVMGEFSAVPEPSSIALLSVIGAGVGYYRFRKKRKEEPSDNTAA